MFAAIRRVSSSLSNLVAERRPRRAAKAMSAIPKSWKPSRRDASSSLYCLIGDFVSQEIAFVGLIKVFVAIVHHGVSISSTVAHDEAGFPLLNKPWQPGGNGGCGPGIGGFGDGGNGGFGSSMRRPALCSNSRRDHCRLSVSQLLCCSRRP
jgi:hypothetical protein